MPYDSTIRSALEICFYYKISTLEKMEALLNENERKIIEFTKIFSTNPYSLDYSIWILGYLLASKNGKSSEVKNYLNYLHIHSNNENDRDELVTKILTIYKQIQ